MTSQDDKLENQSYSELIKTIRNMLHESEQQSNRMMTMTNISVDLSRVTDFDDIIKIVQREAKWLLDFQHCSMIYMNAYGAWESHVLIDRKHTDIKLDVLASTVQNAIKSAKSVVISNEETDFLPEYMHKLILPMSSESQVIGTIQFGSDEPFDDEDLRIGIFLAYQVASSMDKALRIQILMMTQQQLAEYARELSLQNEEIETYNHIIAHDLKSPLSMVLLKVGLIKMSEPNMADNTKKHLSDIEERVRHMEEMIDQLLILARLRHDTNTMTFIHSHSVLERCLKRFPEVETGQVKVEIQADMPQILAHSQWIEEIFANLISNAIKYMGDQPQPIIKVNAEKSDDQIIFSVEDNGIGIRREDQEKLFVKFTRLYDVQSEGFGLGLSIVHRIVENLGGQLGVESEFGKGTRFWFSVPAVEN